MTPRLSTQAAAPGTACLCCGIVDGVFLESSRTAYHWDGVGQNPNADIPLCRDCAVDHHEHWDFMWAEYYAGLL